MTDQDPQEGVSWEFGQEEDQRSRSEERKRWWKPSSGKKKKDKEEDWPDPLPDWPPPEARPVRSWRHNKDGGLREVESQGYGPRDLAALADRYGRRGKAETPLMWLWRVVNQGGDATWLTREEGQAIVGGLTHEPRERQALRQALLGIAPGAEQMILSSWLARGLMRAHPHRRQWERWTEAPWKTLKEGTDRVDQIGLVKLIWDGGEVGTRHTLSDKGNVQLTALELAEWRRAGPPHARRDLRDLQDQTVEDITAKLWNLWEDQDMMDWQDASGRMAGDHRGRVRSRPVAGPPRGRAETRKRPEKGKGPSRMALWRALMAAGVPKEEVDGKPTEELERVCWRKKCHPGAGKGGPRRDGRDQRREDPPLWPKPKPRK